MSEPNVIAAFTEDQAERLTGVSKSQLRYWDRTGFLRPAFASENRRDAYSRIYSFRDIATLRVLNVLRNQNSVPLQHLRKVAGELEQMPDATWLSTQMFVLNKRVIFVDPDTDQYREIVSKQYVIGIPLRIVMEQTQADVKALLTRDPAQEGQIARARHISANAWVIAGTRVPVASIKRLAEDGYTPEQIMREYPRLTAADIHAALAHKDTGRAA